MGTLNNINPKVMFTYFAAVIFFSMFLMHPFFIFPSFVFSFLTNLLINGRKIYHTLLVSLPVLILIIIINPLFNTGGNTVLFYIFKRPFTLEALIYGLFVAMLFFAVINWFSCYNAIITSEKFNYIFGKIMPSTSLLLSMSLRLVPLYKSKLDDVISSREMVGKGVSGGNKIKNGSLILSAIVTNALDGSITTSNSMKSRGFGLKGKTSFAIYRIKPSDLIYLFITLALFISVLGGVISGVAVIQIIPDINIDFDNSVLLFTAVCYSLLLIMPITKKILGDIKWNILKSKI